MASGQAALRAAVVRAALFALGWWVITEGEPGGWAVSLAAVGAATAASLYLLPTRVGSWRPRGLLRFGPRFLHQSLLGGVDVALRALHPRLPLAPGLVDYPLRLPPGAAQVFFANTVSLLPGTVSASLEAGQLRLHVLDTRAAIEARLRPLEDRVADLFGVPLLDEGGAGRRAR